MSDKDVIEWPPHYNKGSIQPIDVIEDWRLPHHAACVVKYVARYQHKGAALNDLKKARWYLDRLIRILESDDGTDNERPPIRGSPRRGKKPRAT